MKVIRREFNVDGYNGEWWLDLYSDTHFGSKSVAETLLRRDINETLNNGHYAVHLGDIIDGVVPKDRRHNPQNLTDWAWAALKEQKLIEAEWEYATDVFSPLKGRLLFLLSGDGKHNRFDDISDCFQSTCNDLETIGGFPSCHLVLSFSRGNSTETKRVELVFHHGHVAGRTNSNKVSNLERDLSFYPGATGFFCGHGHNKVYNRINGLVIEGSKQILWKRVSCMTGSYLRTYADDTVGYGEVKGYPPSAIGHISVCLRPFSKDHDKRIEVFNL